MDNTEFISLRGLFAEVMKKNKKTCKDGYADLLRCNDMQDIAAVIKKYWADLNMALWCDFKKLLVKFYPLLEKELSDNGIYYNASCSSGLCCIDDNGIDCVVTGIAEVMVHGNAFVLAAGQSYCVLLDSSTAEAHDFARIDAKASSKVIAYDFTRIKAFDKSKVLSDGSTELYIYDNAQLENVRCRKLETSNS